MGTEEYLNQILAREAVDAGPFSPVRGVQAVGLTGHPALGRQSPRRCPSKRVFYERNRKRVRNRHRFVHMEPFETPRPSAGRYHYLIG